MLYKLEDYLNRRSNTPKRGLVDGPGGYAGKPKNPELAEERKQKWIKEYGQKEWDKLGPSSKSRVYQGAENVGTGKGSGQKGKPANPEAIEKMAEKRRYKTLDDFEIGRAHV